MVTAAATSLDYRPDINGLRAIAVLSVFFFHLFPGLLPGGFLGVDIFFVISGYLISSIILRENRQGNFSFQHFYARRIKRIFPALFVALLVFFPVAIFLLIPETYINFMRSARYAAAQLANFFFARSVSYFDEGFSGQPLLHTWSLGVEEQFYLFWPLLIVLCFQLLKKSKVLADYTDAACCCLPESSHQHHRMGSDPIVCAVFLLLGLLSFGLCFILVEVNPQRAFYMFYTRAWEFCVGGLLALGLTRKPLARLGGNIVGTAGLLLLGYSFFLVDEQYLGISFLRFGVVLPCIGTALIIATDCRSSCVNRLLATPLFDGVGKISYSLYLYHWPVIILYKRYYHIGEIGMVAAAGIVIVSFLLSTLSYLLVEQPARKNRLSDRHIFGAALMVIILFASAFHHMEKYAEAPWRISRYVNETSITPLENPAAECIKNENIDFDFLECKVAGKEQAPRIALVGDSHAPHYLPAVVSWAKKNGYDVKYIGVAGCLMLLGEVRVKNLLVDSKYMAQCSSALALFASEIASDPKVEVVAIAQRFELFYDGINHPESQKKVFFINESGGIIENYTQYYRKQLGDTVDRLRTMGKEPVILKQVPVFNTIQACEWQPLLKKLFSQPRKCEYDPAYIDKWQRPSIDFIDDFAIAHRILVVDPFPLLDSPEQMGINLYTNPDHLNGHGTQFLIPRFSTAMDGIMAELRERKRHKKST